LNGLKNESADIRHILLVAGELAPVHSPFMDRVSKIKYTKRFIQPHASAGNGRWVLFHRQ